MGFHRDHGVTQITVHNDRPVHITRPDPVAGCEGVFATLAPEEISPAEATRHGTATTGAPPRPAKPPKTWTPKAVLERLTKLYMAFKKPSGKAPPPHPAERGDKTTAQIKTKSRLQRTSTGTTPPRGGSPQPRSTP